MPTAADILDYLGKLFAMWFLRLFAQDAANPDYKYAWMPSIYGKQFGFVICDRPNETKSVNIGPGNYECKDMLDEIDDLRRELAAAGEDIRVPHASVLNTPAEISAVLNMLKRKYARVAEGIPPGGHPAFERPIVPRPLENRD